METKLVNVRIPQQLYSNAELVIKHQGYSSMQELVKEALRIIVQQKIQDIAIVEIRKLAGSQKNKKFISKDKMDFLLLQEQGYISKKEKYSKRKYVQVLKKISVESLSETKNVLGAEISKKGHTFS